jgi:hypothetical protein
MWFSSAGESPADVEEFTEGEISSTEPQQTDCGGSLHQSASPILESSRRGVERFFGNRFLRPVFQTLRFFISKRHGQTPKTRPSVQETDNSAHEHDYRRSLQEILQMLTRFPSVRPLFQEENIALLSG